MGALPNLMRVHGTLTTRMLGVVVRDKFRGTWGKAPLRRLNESPVPYPIIELFSTSSIKRKGGRGGCPNNFIIGQ